MFRVSRLLLLVGVAASLSAVPSPARSASLPLPAGLPTTFGVGLANGPDGLNWMTASNIPWNYRYQYLCGGVNTGGGWAAWNDPPGQFAASYMSSSQAGGYLPVLTYYQLVQSAPNPGSEDLDPKLQDPNMMSAYFADWKVLMQRAGEFGGPVIVHVEPDAWGFMQSAHGDDPASTPAAVSASGFPEASGYEDNARGFAQVLVSLRNAYAPNVVLAWHASTWATGTDLVPNHGDPTDLGGRTAAFFNALSANFDLIFTDPSDRDAGYYQYVYGDGGAHWWGDADFVTFRQWIATLTSLTSRRAMLWQVPVGNTLYRTCNNTNGHYQDNRAQYFLLPGNAQHIVEYANAGVVGILFGAGAGGATDYQDSVGDGITNPAPINGNDRTSTVADDDGGFLREGAAGYYLSGPVRLPN